MVTLSDYQGQQQKVLEASLKNALGSYAKLLPALHEAMHYAVFSGGKRIRPLLVLAAAQSVGGTAEDALPAAVAVELFHTYTLIHDDLPSMDNDDLRRGQPTVHIKFGEANAILAGDALQAAAFSALSSHPQVSRLLHELSATGVGVVAGQWLDMKIEAGSVKETDIEFIHEHKTTDLLRTSARLGAISARATDEQLAAITSYGMELGHLFQLTDDILDAGTEEKPTAVTVYGIKKTRQLAQCALEQAKQSLVNIPSPAILEQLAQYIFNRTT